MPAAPYQVRRMPARYGASNHNEAVDKFRVFFTAMSGVKVACDLPRRAEVGSGERKKGAGVRYATRTWVQVDMIIWSLWDVDSEC